MDNNPWAGFNGIPAGQSGLAPRPLAMRVLGVSNISAAKAAPVGPGGRQSLPFGPSPDGGGDQSSGFDAAPPPGGAPEGFDNDPFESAPDERLPQPGDSCGPGEFWDAQAGRCVAPINQDDERADLPAGCTEYEDGRVLCHTERGHTLAPLQTWEQAAGCIVDQTTGALMCPVGTLLHVPQHVQDLPPIPDSIGADDLPQTTSGDGGAPIVEAGSLQFGGLGLPLLLVGGVVVLSLLKKRPATRRRAPARRR